MEDEERLTLTCTQRLQNAKRILSFLLINGIYVTIGTLVFEKQLKSFVSFKAFPTYIPTKII